MRGGQEALGKRSGVTAPDGFLAAGISASIGRGERDLALLVSVVPATCGAVTTQNRFPAAPVLILREKIRQGPLQAVLMNSGHANACTGEEGLRDARQVIDATARALGLPEERVAMASTGVIGVRLPLERIEAHLPALKEALSQDGGAAAAEAIMTTDLVSKESVRRLVVDGRTVTVGGMAKGSGMIHPNMATMLAFVTTDADVPAEILQDMAGRAALRSFNRISVDGDQSTNDTLLLLANGQSGVRIREGEHLRLLEEAVTAVCRDLAIAIARDGEGATRLLRVLVRGARSEEDAARAARAVVVSPLVKTAVHGQDPNWGRVLAAVGNAGIPVDPNRVALRMGGIPVVAMGLPLPFDEDAARAALGGEEALFEVDLGLGDGEAEAFGCDLSAEYVRINGSYRT